MPIAGWLDSARTAEAAWVLAVGVASALATGLGAIPFAFLDGSARRATGFARALAGGLMLGACFSLAAEATALGPWATLLGGAGGAALVAGLGAALAGRTLDLGSLRGDGAREAILLVVVMTAHSFAEGAAIGVAFGGGAKLALLIGVAISVHNIPEGLAITAVLRPRGVGVGRAALVSILTSAPQPLVAVPAFLAVHWFRPLLPWGLGFAAGAMLLMVLLELLPEAYRDVGPTATAFTVTGGVAAMLALDAAL